MNSRSTVRLALIATLIVAAAVLGYSRYETGVQPASLITAASVVELKDGIPGPDEAAVPTAMAQHPPDSPWLEKRTRRYAALFQGSHCDVLLVPMQVEGGGFDRPSRDIMTAELARALATTGRCVADPYLVDVALGDGLRRRAPESVRALARTMYAREVVTIYAGHYRPGHMRVTLQRADAGASAATLAAHSFDFSGYDREHPPFTVFRAHLPEMLAAIGLQGISIAVGSAAPDLMPATLPRSFDSYLKPPRSDPPSPLAAAAALTFLAMQAPSMEWRAADRLFTKAWVALNVVDDTQPAVRRLRARIMLHLQERPYALSILGNDSGPEADGLRAILNGNLPTAREALSQIKDPWERFFLGIEVADLELAYYRDARASTAQVMGLVHGSPYEAFVHRRLLDRELWSFTTTRGMKLTLDEAFPSRGTEVLIDLISTAKSAFEGQPELATIRRVHQLVEEQPRLWCCESFSANPHASDLLDMLDSRIEHTLIRQVRYFLWPQDLYDRALARLENYDDELAGSPCAEWLRATIYSRLLSSGEIKHREERTKKMHDAARLSAWWSQAQTPEMANALYYMGLRPKDPEERYFWRVTDDYPLRPYWAVTLDRPSGAERLAFSTEDPGALIDRQADVLGDEQALYLQALDSRFIGGPVSTERRIDALPQSLKTAEHLQSEIERDADNWQIYRSLAGIELHAKAYGDVRRTILSYPPFLESQSKDPVGLSNYASEWGHDLLWLGQTSEAQPLLQKAAGYQTGSANGSWSAARLALLNGEYSQAADWFLEIGRHYNNLTAYRELISLLSAAGEETTGRALLDSLTQHYTSSGLWTAAMVGHRRAGMTDAELSGWYASRLRQLAAVGDRDGLRSDAFLEYFIDRRLPADLPATLQSLAEPSDVIVRADGKVYFVAASTATSAPIGPSGFGRQRHAPLTVGSHPADRYAMGVAALIAMQSGRFDDAVTKFDEISAYYSIEREFILPYFAYSAAKTGDALHLSAYLDALPTAQQGYEVTLARAVFAAMAGKRDAALILLDEAFSSWAYVHDDFFPHSAYQYINVCTLVYEASGDPAYRDAALRLARLLRRVEPAFAYGHAAVAYLSTDDQEKVDALRMTSFLDPNSQWASKLPAPLQAAARAWVATHGSPLVGGDKASWLKLDADLAVGN